MYKAGDGDDRIAIRSSPSLALYTTLNIEDNIKESNCEVKTFDCLSTKMKKVKTRYKS